MVEACVAIPFMCCDIITQWNTTYNLLLLNDIIVTIDDDDRMKKWYSLWALLFIVPLFSPGGEVCDGILYSGGGCLSHWSVWAFLESILCQASNLCTVVRAVDLRLSQYYYSDGGGWWLGRRWRVCPVWAEWMVTCLQPLTVTVVLPFIGQAEKTVAGCCVTGKEPGRLVVGWRRRRWLPVLTLQCGFPSPFIPWRLTSSF